MSLRLERIVVFPIKSLEGVEVDAVSVTPAGFLEHDRLYAMLDAEGKYINGKRDARVHRLRCAYDPGCREVRLRVEGSAHEGQFVLAEPAPIGAWLSEYFGLPVTLRYEPNAGFPDDRKAPGPTVVSTESLAEVAGWFPGLSLDSVRCRFRTNLELTGDEAPPFWEDRLFGAPEEQKPFRVGPVAIRGHNPCQRCVVPTRDPVTGEQISGFQKEFMERRRQSLPAWSNTTRFNHFYRFAVNTSIPDSEAGKTLTIGDPVELAAEAVMAPGAS